MVSDLKFTIRYLLKTPGFTAIAVLTLALGIGATTAIFSVVNTVLLKPLPYAQPERLARIYTEFPSFPNGGLHRFAASKPEYLDLRRVAKSWQSIDGWTSSGANITTGTQPMRVTASWVTGGLFSTLGSTAARGRVIVPLDDEPGSQNVAVISYGLWQRAFGGDRNVVGRDILLNGSKHTIVGVMRDQFRFPPDETAASDIWAPLQSNSKRVTHAEWHDLTLLGRLKSGVTLNQAQSELDSLVKHGGLAGAHHPFDPENHTLVTYGLHDEMVRGVRPALQMLFGAVCFLLLITCINVANLLLARSEARQREIAVRGALGAGVWQFVRQFFIESAVLAGAGAVIGLFLAQTGLAIIKNTSMADIPRAADVGIDAQVVIFAVVISILTAVTFGLAPLVHVFKRNLHHVIKSNASATTGAAGTQRFRQGLIVVQLALALVLLTGTGLMLRAFWNVQQVKAGFDPERLVTMSVALPDTAYSDDAVRSFWGRLQERLTALPGVESAALTTNLPPVYSGSNPWILSIEGAASASIKGVMSEGPNRMIDYCPMVSSAYFDALKIRLVAGRFFDERDDAGGSRVAIVNQTLARAYWGNSEAVGRRVGIPGSDIWYTVVGVVSDVKNLGLEKPTGMEVYFPYAQSPLSTELKRVHIIVRSKSDPSLIASAVRREIGELDPGLPLASVRTMHEVILETQSRPRFLTLILTLFAGISLALAAIGVYGVIAYAVAQRTKEFGLRMALGAQPRNVLGLVLRRGVLLTVLGIAIGLAGALAATRALSGWLFGLTPTDPVTFAVVSLLLAAIAVLASYIPARRATRVDPLVALRAE